MDLHDYKDVALKSLTSIKIMYGTKRMRKLRRVSGF